jgi:hypothetical protein
MTFDYIKNAAGHFVCQHKGCSKTFARQNTMYYHMKRHAGEFTYTCAECKKGFIQKSAFLHHQAAVHHDKVAVASTCGDPQDCIINTDNYNPNNPNNPNTIIVVESQNNNNNVIKATEIVESNTKIVNPYAGITYKCPCCDHSTRTKANALVHYARLHAEGWIPTYDKAKGCSHCAKTFSSIAAYLYHCTGCIPANKTHRAAVARMMESA